MFGYVRPYTPELFVRENEFYHAVYCGLCRVMKKTTGRLSTLTLNYDMVFLALVRIVQERDTCSDRQRRCIAHPTRRRPMLEANPSLEYSARVSALLTYANLKDNIRDARRMRRAVCRATLPFFAHARRRANLKELDAKITACLAELNEIETSRVPSADAPADAFGRLLGEVFAYGVRPLEEATARAIGYHLGKFIYVSDAVEDYEKDRASGNYNPFVAIHDGGLTPEDRATIGCVMKIALTDLERAVSELDFTGYATIEGLIKNIVCLGLPKRIEQIISPAGEKPHSREKESIDRGDFHERTV